MRSWLAFAVLVLFGGSVPGKKTASSEPLIVDVHAAPYRKAIVYTTNVSHQRFDMRHATVLDMIEFAYNLGEQDDDRENAAIIGGPAWIDFDRFDVAAKVPSEELEDIRRVTQRVLAERFKLVFHTEDRPLPGYLVTVAIGGARLAEAKDAAAPSECHSTRDRTRPEQYTLTCTSETMAQFVATLDQDFPHAILDRTGLTQAYDFTVKLVLGPEVHTRDDRARVYTEALSRQLGLVVTRGGVPQAAIVVDTVERPAANPPESATLLPALPDLEFEVASIRLAAETDAQAQIRPTGSQITFSSFTLQDLIVRAWQLPTGLMLGDALPLLPTTRFTILVKLPQGVDGRAVYNDRDQIDNMLRKLLIDRFKVRYHWGEWTQPDAYVLLAGTPRMKKAGAGSRSFCKFGPVEGEKSARSAVDSAFDGEFHCQNVTMPQFADLVQALAGADVKNRVPDKTGLGGAYDFSVFYTTGRTLRTRGAAAAAEAKQAGEAAAAPVAGLSLEDAFRKQLGLRLVRQPQVLPALILDHFEKMPTLN